MYKLKKTFTISAAHHLNLDYESKCTSDHGHSWKITVYLASYKLNKYGMILDFMEIKRKVEEQLDHKNLNAVEEIGFEVLLSNSSRKVELNPTAERLAQWICCQFSNCYQVDVQESEGSVATYVDDSFTEQIDG